MATIFRKFLLALAVLAIGWGEPGMAAANPIGDFFKKVGRSISHWRKSPPPPRPHKKTGTANDSASEETKATPETRMKMAPSPTPTPIDVRPAALAPRSSERRDVPYAVAVPNKPGFVTSPYAPDQGLVDVRAFPSSTEVLDPFTGKIFLTP